MVASGSVHSLSLWWTCSSRGSWLCCGIRFLCFGVLVSPVAPDCKSRWWGFFPHISLKTTFFYLCEIPYVGSVYYICFFLIFFNSTEASAWNGWSFSNNTAAGRVHPGRKSTLFHYSGLWFIIVEQLWKCGHITLSFHALVTTVNQ